MQVGAKDKRLKALNRGERDVKGLQPGEETLIIDMLAAFIAAKNIEEVQDGHPSWRVHQHKPKKKNKWGADVTGNDRLYFYYDAKTHVISGMWFGDDH